LGARSRDELSTRGGPILSAAPPALPRPPAHFPRALRVTILRGESWRARTARPLHRGRTRMKRIAGIVAALGLVVAGQAYAAETSTETKTEHKADAKGSKQKVEKSAKHDGASHHEKATVETEKRADGKTETKKRSSTAVKGRHAKKHKTDTKEKTVRDAQGNVVEHEKTTK
jgi:hypothetical protein